MLLNFVFDNYVKHWLLAIACRVCIDGLRLLAGCAIHTCALTIDGMKIYILTRFLVVRESLSTRHELR
jgi:hypothetical protein